MDPIISFIVVLLVIGLVGNGFEMRKVRLSIVKDKDLTSKNVFLNKRNWKWYILIAVALILWSVSNALTRGTI